MIIANAFSLQMLGNISDITCIIVEPMTTEAVKETLCREGVESCIGHADTATVLSNILGMEIPCNRKSITLPKEGIIVAQFSGQRLPEGCTTLPEGSVLKFFYVGYKPALPMAGVDY